MKPASSLKKILIGFAGFVLLLVFIFSIFEVMGWPFLQIPIQNFMQEKLKRTIKIDGPFKIKFLGGIHLKAGGFWISSPVDFKEPYLADAKVLELDLRYSDLWNIKPGDPYLIKTIKVEKIDANLIRNSDGQSTWQFNQDKNDPIRPFPLIQTLIVRQGQAKIKDELTKANIDMKFATDEGSSNSKPTSTISIKGSFRERAIKSELTTGGFLPIASQDSNSPPVSSKGWLDYGQIHIVFDGSVYDLFGAQNIKGIVAVSGSSLGQLGDLLSITLPATAPFKTNGQVEKNKEGWKVSIASLTVGQSRLSGNFHYDPRPEKGELSGVLKGKRLVLADLAPSFGASDIDSSTQPDRIFPDRTLNFSTYNRMNAKIDIDLDYVDLGKLFREPITPLQAHLDLNKNKLSLAKIFAKTAEGSILGTVFIDSHQKNTSNSAEEKNQSDKPKPEWAIDLAVKSINLAKWLQISDKRKKEAKQNNKPVESEAYVTGFLNGTLKLHGLGNSTAELMKTLSGNASLYIQNGTISHLVIEAAGIDIAQAVGLMIKGDEPLTMQCSVLDIQAQQGILSPKIALVDTSVTTLYLTGNVNMGEEDLHLNLRAEPKNFSPFTARAPILITGKLAHPDVSPAKGPIAARIAGATALVIINPLALILPFLDPGTSKSKSAGCTTTLENLKKSQQIRPTETKSK